MRRSNRHYSPSTIRYRKAHPVLGCVLTSELKSTLDRWRSDLSYGAFIKKLLTTKGKPYSLGYKKGFKDAEEQYRIQVNCWLCRKLITLDPEETKVMEVVRKAFEHHVCAECYTKLKKEKKVR